MRTITVYYSRTSYVYKWLKPLFEFRNAFKQYGYKIEYSSILDYIPSYRIWGEDKAEKMSIRHAMKHENDIVFLAFSSTKSYLGTCSNDKRKNILLQIKRHCKTLVWLDTSDSTGTCRFDVLPYVDLYFKKQYLKNIKDYFSPIWGGRIHCDYYHSLLNIDDSQIRDSMYPVLKEEYVHKLRLSWNVSLADLFVDNGIKMYMKPFNRTIPKFVNPESHIKTLDLQYRGSSFSPVAGYQRQESKRLVSEIDYISHSDCNKAIPYNEYVKEGKIAKAILSPFGWGEVCGRDFEAMVYGSTLLKHSMSHCITWPNAYQEWVTYVPLAWDFSDFHEKLKNIGSEQYLKIAKQAQKWYKHLFEPHFSAEFAKHIIEELER